MKKKISFWVLYLKILEYVAPFWIVDGEHVPARHEAGLDVPELEPVQRQHVLLVLLLKNQIIDEFGETIWQLTKLNING